jgi:uncharacterized damage-inducible protein DinB
MSNVESLRERFLRDTISTRLGNLGSNLARISSFSKYDEMQETVRDVANESRLFIEWISADVSIEERVVLSNLGNILLEWLQDWDNNWNDVARRNAIASQAMRWSERILDMSGMLSAKKIEEQYKDRFASRAVPLKYPNTFEATQKVAEPQSVIQKPFVEPWLRGPIEGVHPTWTPIAHSLMQVIEDLPQVVSALTQEQLWSTPGGAASVGFHLKHMASSLDRLYTYARGEKLTDEQFAVLRSEKDADNGTVDELLAAAISQIEKAIQQLRETKTETLYDTRLVGRAGLPSNQLALLYHGAEHAQRHIGAMIATAKVVRDFLK